MVDLERVADFGGRLQRQREQRGLSLREIADRIKVSARTLDALERNDVSPLPSGIFARAIVRAYAGEIGLEPEAVVRDFLARFPQDPSLGGGRPISRPDLAVPQRGGVRPVALVISVVIPVIIAVILLLSQL